MTKARGRRKHKRKATKREIEAMNERIERRHAVEVYEDPRSVVITARSRLIGEAASDSLLSPMLCEPAGRAIKIGARNSDEAGKLWDVFKRLDAADETYFRRAIGRPRFPSVAKLEMMPETFETRPDDKPDLRDKDQKDRDAVNSWMRWQGYMGCLASHERHAITSVMRHTAGDTHVGQTLTTAGQAFVAAMRVLRLVEGKA